MFSHIMLGANDLEKSRRFYDKTISAIGGREGSAMPGDRYFWRHNGGTFVLTKPLNGEAACNGNGSTIGFDCGGPEQVDAWHQAGLAAGGESCEDPPGWRDGAMGKMYLAYLRDPAGNKLCGFHRPE